MSNISLYVGSLASIPTRDHNLLTSLLADDHTQYALLAGRVTPQIFAFGSVSGAATGYLTSTSHVTKGKYFLNAAGTIVINEVDARIGIGTNAPTTVLGLHHATSAFLRVTEAGVGFDGRFGADIGGVQIGSWTNSNLSLITNATKRWDVQYDGVLISLGSYIDLSAISAGNPNLKITPTSDVVTATPATVNPTGGWLEVVSGSTPLYLPLYTLTGA